LSSDDYARPFNAKDPLFTRIFTPENILAKVQAGTWVVASYEFGMRCACGFVMWNKYDRIFESSRVEVHHLQSSVGDDVATFDLTSPPHLSYPEIPRWVKKRASDHSDASEHLILFVIYEGDQVVFMGFNGASENEESMKGLQTEEERNAMLRKYIRDQFGKMSFYRTVNAMR